MIQLSKSKDVNAPKLSQLLIELGRTISNSLGTSGERATGIPGLMLYRCTAPTAPQSVHLRAKSPCHRARKEARRPRQDQLRLRAVAISPNLCRTADYKPSGHGHRRRTLPSLFPKVGYTGCSRHSEYGRSSRAGVVYWDSRNGYRGGHGRTGPLVFSDDGYS